MNYGDPSSIEIMINAPSPPADSCHCLERISSSAKRKLDDYGLGEDDFSDLVAVRMRKDESDQSFDSSLPPFPALCLDPLFANFNFGSGEDDALVFDSIPFVTSGIAGEEGGFVGMGGGQSRDRMGHGSEIAQSLGSEPCENQNPSVDICDSVQGRIGWGGVLSDDGESETVSSRYLNNDDGYFLRGSVDEFGENGSREADSECQLSAYLFQSVGGILAATIDLNQPPKDMEMGTVSTEGEFSNGVSVDDGMSVEDVSKLHFFVRMISGSRTLVLHANPWDTIQSVHEQIRLLIGIPVGEQRLIYSGKQLSLERSLEECCIQNDATLQLVGRMRSTEYPNSWQLINDVVSLICRLHTGESTPDGGHLYGLQESLPCRVKEFLKMASKAGIDVPGHLQVFLLAGAPSALVMLYLSSVRTNRDCAENSIRIFLSSNSDYLTERTHDHCAPILLEFCKLLSNTDRFDPLYIACRHALASLLKKWGVAHGIEYFDHAKASTIIQELFPFVREMAGRLCSELTMEVPPPSMIDVHDFAAFLLALRKAIEDRMGIEGLASINHSKAKNLYMGFESEIETLHQIFMDLLEKIKQCLGKLEIFLSQPGTTESESHVQGRLGYLVLLKELNGVSKLYEGAEENFCSVLRLRCSSLNALIKHVKRDDDHLWLLKHKDVTDFDSKRHLLQLIFPDAKDDYGEMHEMLIDRSHILAESYEYIARADRDALQGGLFMEFKDEEATGPGVLREWFCLVCRAIFNPQNPLFLSCPNDRRRFFPNPASHVDPLHLEYFGFCGRLIALALMHKVQVDVVFARVFFLQLAGSAISLDDVQDADPCMYSSCKKILELDADLLDSDALGLTFVREIEELGSRRVVELCQGGRDTAVNSSNRDRYVDLLIRHCFVTSVSEQVAHFAKGFSDILEKPELGRFFFQSLDLKDLDFMLHGSDRAICVKDWKAHTEYHGYKETDKQIRWFWQVVEGMSAEQHSLLLFFWTSICYLPVEGFGGLPSKLYIYKALESKNSLPTSHTCFYRLCFPPYPSISMMRDSLHMITQEHVSCSFGTW